MSSEVVNDALMEDSSAFMARVNHPIVLEYNLLDLLLHLNKIHDTELLNIPAQATDEIHGMLMTVVGSADSNMNPGVITAAHIRGFRKLQSWACSHPMMESYYEQQIEIGQIQNAVRVFAQLAYREEVAQSTAKFIQIVPIIEEIYMPAASDAQEIDGLLTGDLGKILTNLRFQSFNQARAVYHQLENYRNSDENNQILRLKQEKLPILYQGYYPTLSALAIKDQISQDHNNTLNIRTWLAMSTPGSHARIYCPSLSPDMEKKLEHRRRLVWDKVGLPNDMEPLNIADPKVMAEQLREEYHQGKVHTILGNEPQFIPIYKGVPGSIDLRSLPY